MKIKALLMASLLISFVQASETTRPIELVKLRYCDLTGSKYETSRILDLQTLEQNQKKEFCVDIINTWKEWVSIWMNIVDWTLTADSEQKRACEPEWTKSLFWDLLQDMKLAFLSAEIQLNKFTLLSNFELDRYDKNMVASHYIM